MGVVSPESGFHTYASAIVGAQKVHARKPADFYPTPPDVTHALCRFLDLKYGTYVWEPACGDGAMAKVLKQYVGDPHVYATDLREDSGYGNENGLDFLQYDMNPPTGIPISAVFNEWIVTNPPFSVAAAFIEKALLITPNVAMLLKSQFWHAKGRLPLFERHPPKYILPLTWRPSFLEAERGTSPLMDVIWCVWMPNTSDTLYRPLRRPAQPKESQTLDKVEKPTDPIFDLL